METLENVKSLIEDQAILVRQLEAKQKRIDFLETRVEQLEEIIAQRYEETKRAFNPDARDEMKNKVYCLWLDNEPGTGFTYEQAQDEFYKKYHFKSANVGQRMRDLRLENPPRLWSKEVNGKTTFFLTLKT